MGYRLDELTPGEIYHVYTRSVERKTIFRHNQDHQRFCALMLHCLPGGNIQSYSIALKFQIIPQRTDEGKGLVDILGYCLMSNHVHLLLKENQKGGISFYMQRLLKSYAKFFNMSEDRSGSLFVNPFRSVLVDSDAQLLHVSRYIHLNPYVAHMVDNIFKYPWSSLSEYVDAVKKSICHTSLIKSMLSPTEYSKFIIDEAGYARANYDAQHLLLDN